MSRKSDTIWDMIGEKTYSYIDDALLNELQSFIDENYEPEVEYPCCSQISDVTRMMKDADEEPRFKGFGFFGKRKSVREEPEKQALGSGTAARVPESDAFLGAPAADMSPEECFEADEAADYFNEPFLGALPSEETVCLSGNAKMATPSSNEDGKSLKEMLDEIDEPFSTTLLKIIDARGLVDADVYNRAGISRQHFSKIRSERDYRPTKRTALALAVAMELNLQDTQDLLGRAGFTLTHSSLSDVIVEFFIKRGDYDFQRIDETLYAHDQQPLRKLTA